MKIIFNDDIQIVKIAVEESNTILRDKIFLDAIAKHPGFDLSTAKPSIISDLLAKSNLEFRVEIFYPNGLQLLKYRKLLPTRMKGIQTLYF